MDITNTIAFISVVISFLGFVVGLPAVYYSAKKQYAEAAKALAEEQKLLAEKKALLAEATESYSNAARQAVESQTQLQSQINVLREEIGKRDSRILDLEEEIRCLYQGQADKEKQIKDLEKLTELQAEEITGLRKEIAKMQKK